jgi:hypothetical protein
LCDPTKWNYVREVFREIFLAIFHPRPKTGISRF